MASNFSVCGICDFRHVTKPSVVWCSECDEGLCNDCKEHHSISKSSRDHDIVPIDDYQNLPSEVLQHKLIEELNLTIDKQTKDIHQFLKLVEKNEKDIKEFQSNHLKMKQHASELQTFLNLKQMERDIATKEEFIQSISKSGSLSHTRFFCKIDTYLENLTNDVKRFGEVVTETKSNDIPFVRQKDKQAAQSLIPVPAKSIDDLKTNVGSVLNTLSRSTRGCAMLTDGKMVFTCYTQGYFTVVNPDGSKYCEIKTEMFLMFYIYAIIL
ncbi:unnamed protein product [Mytilus edulis]|uniref:B box-type domain-containing protein n=1 Tax=Mytilus edulis TaxID=6550 RepID=A0A8S3VAQ1_MYTED|nr:unnamed protein product [Mytilus edulis]